MNLGIIRECIIKSSNGTPLNRFSCMGDFRMLFDRTDNAWKGKWVSKNPSFEKNGLLDGELNSLLDYVNFISEKFPNGEDETLAQYAYENAENVGNKGNKHYLGREIAGGSYFLVQIDTSPTNNEFPICLTLYRENA